MAHAAGAQAPAYQDGSAAVARFRGVAGLAAAPDGTLLIADDGNNVLRRLYASGVVSTVATGFAAPNQVAVSAAGEIFVRRSLSRFLASDVVRVSPSGTLSAYVSANGDATALAVDQAGNLYISDGQAVSTLTRVDRDRTKTMLVADLRVSALTVDSAGTRYFVGYKNRELQVGTVNPAGQVALVATASGNPALAAAATHAINNIAVDDQRNIYFPAGKFIRRLAPDGAVTTVADLSPFAPSDAFIFGLALLRGALYASVANTLVKVPL